MKKYAIVHANRQQNPVAYLTYHEKRKEFRISINRDTIAQDAPFMLGLFIQKGIYEVDSQWSGRWVKERIVPAERQNIGRILRANQLTHYDEAVFLELGQGRTVQDDFMVLPEENVRKSGKRGTLSIADAPAFAPADIKAIRAAAGMSQQQFAACMGVSVRTVEAWECGRNHPDGAASRMLSLLQKEPELFYKTGIAKRN